MKEAYDKGVAFIFEGDTERYFYINLLEFLCTKHDGWSFSEIDSDLGGVYMLEDHTRRVIVKVNTVGTITQMVHSSNWFNNACANKYSAKMPWCVFLCYDTDSHESDISKFQAGDWKKLRSNLTKRKNIEVIDMAAAADIEDVFLTDLNSIGDFLQIEKVPQTATELKGRKGKVKLKNLFRTVGKVYHEGIRAKALIEALDKQAIMDSGILPLSKIEEHIFEE